jgi:hypothetical protein
MRNPLPATIRDLHVPAPLPRRRGSERSFPLSFAVPSHAQPRSPAGLQVDGLGTCRTEGIPTTPCSWLLAVCRAATLSRFGFARPARTASATTASPASLPGFRTQSRERAKQARPELLQLETRSARTSPISSRPTEYEQNRRAHPDWVPSGIVLEPPKKSTFDLGIRDQGQSGGRRYNAREGQDEIAVQT